MPSLFVSLHVSLTTVSMVADDERAVSSIKKRDEDAYQAMDPCAV